MCSSWNGNHSDHFTKGLLRKSMNEQMNGEDEKQRKAQSNQQLLGMLGE